MNDAGAPLALDRCMRLLEALVALPEGATLTMLARSLGTPKSSLLSLLRGLKASGYVAEQGLVYRLGPAMLALAGRIVGGQEPLETVARPILQRLADDAEETSILAVMTADERATRYVAMVEIDAALRFAVKVGSRRPLHASASGLLLAAFQDEAWIDGFLGETALDAYTDTTVTDPVMLRIMLRNIREEEFAITNESMTVGVTGLAAPVRDAEGVVRAALLLGGPSARMTRKLDQLRDALVRNAQALSGLPAVTFERASGQAPRQDETRFTAKESEHVGA